MNEQRGIPSSSVNSYGSSTLKANWRSKSTARFSHKDEFPKGFEKLCVVA
jgi:hypothetical protein